MQVGQSATRKPIRLKSAFATALLLRNNALRDPDDPIKKSNLSYTFRLKHKSSARHQSRLRP